MKLYLKMAWRNLGKNKRRTFSTGAAIVAGYAGLCLLGGYIIRSEDYMATNAIYINHTGHIAIYKKDGVESYFKSPEKYHLTENDLTQINQELEKLPEVDFTAPILTGMGLVSNGVKSVPFLGYGIDPQDEKKIQDHPLVRAWIQEMNPSSDSSSASIQKAVGSLENTVSITKQLAELIGRKLPLMSLSPEEKDIQLAGRNFFGDFNAVNVNLGFEHTTGFSMMEDTSLIAPIRVLRDLFSTEGATYVAVYLKDRSAAGRIVNHLKSQFEKAGWEYDVLPYNNERVGLFYVGTMGFLYIMAGFFVFLIFSAVTLSIVNSLTISLIERVREIGTLRAIGFNESQTSWLIALESALLTVVGLTVGFILTQILAAIVNSMNVRFEPPGVSGTMQFALNPTLWFCLLLAIPVFIICVVCAYYVTKKMVAKKIVSLLQQAN